MNRELVKTTGATYLVTHTDSEVTKDVGKVLVATGTGGMVLLGLASVFGLLAPFILVMLTVAGACLWYKGAS